MLAPQIRVQRIGERLRVSGRVPTGAAAGLVEALRARFSGAQIDSTPTENARTADIEWIWKSWTACPVRLRKC